MIMNSRRLLCQLLLTSASQAFQPAFVVPAQRTFVSSQQVLFAALSADYPTRAAANNFDPPETIVTALKKPTTYLLDVRGADEIAQAKFTAPNGVTWVTTPCSKAECPELESDPTKFLPNKDAIIVVHCASGIRANTAKQTLKRLGYINVLNAGGLNDILAISEDL
jgi:rhodanese-related sulfurtransferase